jgi:pimeloyl-ACP methyl ester carboxylesterase
VAYDRAGLGWSDPAPWGRSYDDMARDLDALLTVIGEPPPFVLVGGSFGGLVVRAFSRMFPDKVAGMVLVDTAQEEKYFGTMATMRAVHEEELKSTARRAATGELRSDAEASLAKVPGLDSRTREAMLHVLGLEGHFTAAVDELRAMDHATPEEKVVGGFGTLGDRPLMVLSHGQPYVGAMAIWEEGWGEAQQRLSALSTNSAHVVATRNGHSIAAQNPRLVAASIQAVVTAARGGALEVESVRRLAHQE